VDIAQFRSWFDAKLIDQSPACLLVCMQGLSPSPGRGQREHELGVEPFLQRMLRRYRAGSTVGSQVEFVNSSLTLAPGFSGGQFKMETPNDNSTYLIIDSISSDGWRGTRRQLGYSPDGSQWQGPSPQGSDQRFGIPSRWVGALHQHHLYYVSRYSGCPSGHPRPSRQIRRWGSMTFRCWGRTGPTAVPRTTPC
jgi:hypothetical protein